MFASGRDQWFSDRSFISVITGLSAGLHVFSLVIGPIGCSISLIELAEGAESSFVHSPFLNLWISGTNNLSSSFCFFPSALEDKREGVNRGGIG